MTPPRERRPARDADAGVPRDVPLAHWARARLAPGRTPASRAEGVDGGQRGIRRHRDGLVAEAAEAVHERMELARGALPPPAPAAASCKGSRATSMKKRALSATAPRVAMTTAPRPTSSTAEAAGASGEPEAGGEGLRKFAAEVANDSGDLRCAAEDVGVLRGLFHGGRCLHVDLRPLTAPDAVGQDEASATLPTASTA